LAVYTLLNICIQSVSCVPLLHSKYVGAQELVGLKKYSKIVVVSQKKWTEIVLAGKPICIWS